MRKFFLFALLCLMALAVWARDKPWPGGSAGLGVIFTNDFSGNIDVSSEDLSLTLPMNLFNVGIYGYGDFAYVEILCGLFFGTDTDSYFNYLGATIGLFGKYPFVLSQKISMFPLLGFEFHGALFGIFSAMHFENGHINWNQFWFKTGAGLDYKINEKIHLRFEALYGLRLKSEAKNDMMDGLRVIINDNIGHGFTLRVAVGV